MKIQITYKHPDAVFYAVNDAIADFSGPKEDIDDFRESIESAIYEALGSSEYVTIEVDTETKAVTFVKRK